MMNMALGVITVLAVVVVLGAVGWELLTRRARKASQIHSLNADLRAMLHAGSHSLSVPGLGLTMADGGEKVEPSDSKASDQKLRK